MRSGAQALAKFEASRTLDRAREAVNFVTQQWKRDEQHTLLSSGEAMKAVGWHRAIDMVVERAAQIKAPDVRR